MKRKDRGRDDEEVHHARATTKRRAAMKTGKIEIPSRVVTLESSFQSAVGVFEQSETDLERGFNEWLKTPCTSCCPHFITIVLSVLK